MSRYLGDFAEDSTVNVYFTTSDSNGGAVAPSSPFEAADVVIYKDNSATQKTTTNGLVMTSPFDAITGLHQLSIDTSDDTGDAGFWTTGSDYNVVLDPDETVDSQAVVSVIASFSIENRNEVSASAIADAVWDEVISNSAHNGAQSAGKRLRQSSGVTVVEGTISDVSPTSTSFDTDLTAVSGFYDDQLFLFTSGSLAGQSKPVLAYTQSNGQVTVAEAFTAAPSNGDEFEIRADHIHPTSQIADSIWDEVDSGHGTANTFGKTLQDLSSKLPNISEFDNSTDDVTLSTSEDVYFADINLAVHDDSSEDHWTVQWIKNGAPVTSGITSPTIQAVKWLDGADLIEETALSEIGSSGAYKYLAEAGERLTDGSENPVVVIVKANIDSAERIWRKVLSRDTTA